MPEEACPSGRATAGPDDPAAQTEVTGWSVGLGAPHDGAGCAPPAQATGRSGPLLRGLKCSADSSTETEISVTKKVKW